jgi:hypothetical protein
MGPTGYMKVYSRARRIARRGITRAAYSTSPGRRGGRTRLCTRFGAPENVILYNYRIVYQFIIDKEYCV